MFRKLKKIKLFSVAAILGLCCSSLIAQIDSNRSTNPNPPILKYDPINRIQMATQIPHPIDKYIYRVTGKIGGRGKVFYTDKVPLWTFTPHPFRVGEVAVGSEFKPVRIRGVEGRTFYGVERSVKLGTKEIIEIHWLDGVFLEVAGLNPKAAAK